MAYTSKLPNKSRVVKRGDYVDNTDKYKVCATAPVIAFFEKISKEAYDAYLGNHKDDVVNGRPHAYVAYDDVKMPFRKTMGSSGHDIYLTESICLAPGEAIIVPTFLKCDIDIQFTMFVLPKSGLGFKYQMMLANTVGLIDADYYNCESSDDSNEGHIMIKIVNGGNREISLEAGSAFCQAVFVPYGVAEQTNDFRIRSGGFGSTGLD